MSIRVDELDVEGTVFGATEPGAKAARRLDRIAQAHLKNSLGNALSPLAVSGEGEILLRSVDHSWLNRIRSGETDLDFARRWARDVSQSIAERAMGSLDNGDIIQFRDRAEMIAQFVLSEAQSAAMPGGASESWWIALIRRQLAPGSPPGTALFEALTGDRKNIPAVLLHLKQQNGLQRILTTLSEEQLRRLWALVGVDLPPRLAAAYSAKENDSRSVTASNPDGAVQTGADGTASRETEMPLPEHGRTAMSGYTELIATQERESRLRIPFLAACVIADRLDLWRALPPPHQGPHSPIGVAPGVGGGQKKESGPGGNDNSDEGAQRSRIELPESHKATPTLSKTGSKPNTKDRKIQRASTAKRDTGRNRSAARDPSFRGVLLKEFAACWDGLVDWQDASSLTDAALASLIYLCESGWTIPRSGTHGAFDADAISDLAAQGFDWLDLDRLQAGFMDATPPIAGAEADGILPFVHTGQSSEFGQTEQASFPVKSRNSKPHRAAPQNGAKHSRASSATPGALPRTIHGGNASHIVAATPKQRRILMDLRDTIADFVPRLPIGRQAPPRLCLDLYASYLFRFPDDADTPIVCTLIQLVVQAAVERQSIAPDNPGSKARPGAILETMPAAGSANGAGSHKGSHPPATAPGIPVDPGGSRRAKQGPHQEDDAPDPKARSQTTQAGARAEVKPLDRAQGSTTPNTAEGGPETLDTKIPLNTVSEEKNISDGKSPKDTLPEKASISPNSEANPTPTGQEERHGKNFGKAPSDQPPPSQIMADTQDPAATWGRQPTSAPALGATRPAASADNSTTPTISDAASAIRKLGREAEAAVEALAAKIARRPTPASRRNLAGDWIDTPNAGLFHLFRGILDSRLYADAKRERYPGYTDAHHPGDFLHLIAMTLAGPAFADSALALFGCLEQARSISDTVHRWSTVSDCEHADFQRTLLQSCLENGLIDGSRLDLWRITLRGGESGLVAGSSTPAIGFVIGRADKDSTAAQQARELYEHWAGAAGSPPAMVICNCEGEDWPDAATPPDEAHETARRWIEKSMKHWGPPPMLGLHTGVTARAAASIAIAAWSRWLKGVSGSGPGFMMRNFLRQPGRVRLIPGERIDVEIHPGPMDVVLELSGYLEPIEAIPWLDGIGLSVRIGKGTQE